MKTWKKSRFIIVCLFLCAWTMEVFAYGGLLPRARLMKHCFENLFIIQERIEEHLNAFPQQDSKVTPLSGFPEVTKGLDPKLITCPLEEGNLNQIRPYQVLVTASGVPQVFCPYHLSVDAETLLPGIASLSISQEIIDNTVNTQVAGNAQRLALILVAFLGGFLLLELCLFWWNPSHGPTVGPLLARPCLAGIGALLLFVIGSKILLPMPFRHILFGADSGTITKISGIIIGIFLGCRAILGQVVKE